MAERDKLERAITALEAQRDVLGSSVVETATAELRQKLGALKALTSDRRQRVTVLFADVSGFTALSERLDPEEVQDLLARLWRRLDRAIVAQRGHIDKHIGDAVMAVWGLTQTRADDAECAVRAALSMQTELALFRQGEHVELGMRVGINSGLCSVSVVESTGEANLIGDTVNLASRLEHAAPVGSVLIGEAPRESVRERFELEALPPLTIKGKTEPVRAFVALRELPRALRVPTRTLTGSDDHTVGREVVLGQLLSGYQRAREGTTTWLVLEGEAGIGKSRVLSDFDTLIHLQGERIRALRLPSFPEDASIAFRTLRRLLERVASTAEGSPAETVATALEQQLALALGSEATEARHVLGQLVGLSSAGLELGADQRRGRATVLLRRYFEAITAQSVLVFELDDAHWADPDSLALLRDVMLANPKQRLLTVATCRAGQAIAGGERILLPALSLEASRALAEQLLVRLQSPPSWLLALLVERSGGNPHFMEELVRWLLAHGVIDADDLRWRAPDSAPADLAVPSRIEALLATRLESLPAAQREILSRAAVVGPTFWLGALSAMGTRCDDDVLAALEDGDFVVRSTASQLVGEVEYVFRSTLLRDVAYEYTLLRARREHHAHCADWLAAHPQADARSIALHYEGARQLAQAAEWYCKAGELSHERGAPEAAVQEYRQGLKLAPSDARALLARGYEGLGSALQQRGQYAEALAAFEELRALAVLLGDARLQAAAHNGASWGHGQSGALEAAVRSAARAEAVLRSSFEAGAPRGAAEMKELASALVNRAWGEVLMGRAREAERTAHDALRVTEGQLSRERALAYNVLGVAAYLWDDRYDEAARYLELSLGLQRERGDRWGVACQLNNLSDLGRIRGDHRAVCELAAEALNKAREIDDHGLQVNALTNMGWGRIGVGEHAAAEQALREALGRAAARGEGYAGLSETERALAEALAHQGRGEEALRHALRALDLAQSGKNPEQLGAAWRLLGDLLSGRVGPASTVILRPSVEALGRSVDAEECFATSLRTFVELGLTREQRLTYLAWADYESDRGQHERARELGALAAALR